MQHIPYSQRDLIEIQNEIDHYEESIPHDHLPARYDALVSYRNIRIARTSEVQSNA